MHKRIILVIVIFFLFNTACASKQNDLTKNTKATQPFSIFLKLGNEQGFTKGSRQNFCYYLEKHYLKGDIKINATNDKPVEAQLITLLDYKQYSSSPITLFPNKINSVPFNVSVKEKGIHDLLFIIVLAPQQHSFNMDFRSNASSLILGLKVNLVKDKNDSMPKLNIVKGTTNNSSKGPSLVINKESLGTDGPIWVKEETFPGRKQYYIHLTNYDNVTATYALLVFFDNNQISVFDKYDQYVSYVCLMKGETVSIPVFLSIPDVKGVHELFSVVVPNPFKRLIDSQSNPIQMNNIARSSLRVGISVN